MVHLAPEENELFDRAQKTGEAQHAVADGSPGLLRLLGSDEALVAPINRGFLIPSFVVMDRALSGTPIRMPQDQVGAEALAGTASLLINEQGGLDAARYEDLASRRNDRRVYLME